MLIYTYTHMHTQHVSPSLKRDARLFSQETAFYGFLMEKHNLKKNLVLKIIFFVCGMVFCLHVLYVWAIYACRAHGGLKKAFDFLELEFEVVVSCNA